MHPLHNDFGSIAAITPVLRQSPESGSYSAAPPSAFGQARALPAHFLRRNTGRRDQERSKRDKKNDGTAMPTLRRRLVRVGMWRRKDLVETKMASGFASLPRCMMRLVSAAIISK
jgi:hypothetical protein